MSVRAHVWNIIEGKYLAIEVLGHKLYTSSILFGIAKLISKWVAPICIHSGHVWVSFSTYSAKIGIISWVGNGVSF